MRSTKDRFRSSIVRWRLVDLAQWIFEEFRVSVSVQTLSRELRAIGYRRLSARPRHHAQAEGAMAFSRAFRGDPAGAYGDLVRGRGMHRSEEQDHAALGKARDQAFGTFRPAYRLLSWLRLSEEFPASDK